MSSSYVSPSSKRPRNAKRNRTTTTDPNKASLSFTGRRRLLTLRCRLAWPQGTAHAKGKLLATSSSLRCSTAVRSPSSTSSRGLRVEPSQVGVEDGVSGDGQLGVEAPSARVLPSLPRPPGRIQKVDPPYQTTCHVAFKSPFRYPSLGHSMEP